MVVQISHEEKQLNEALQNVKAQSAQMRRCFEKSKLMDGLKFCSTMLNELRTSDLSPKSYYALYMAVVDELRYLDIYLMEEVQKNIKITDIYELVQYAGNIVPRLYLLITVGMVYVRVYEAAKRDIIRDLVDMCRGVQHPLRGLFLRYYLLQSLRASLPDQPYLPGTATASQNLINMPSFVGSRDSAPTATSAPDGDHSEVSGNASGMIDTEGAAVNGGADEKADNGVTDQGGDDHENGDNATSEKASPADDNNEGREMVESIGVKNVVEDPITTPALTPGSDVVDSPQSPPLIVSGTVRDSIDFLLLNFGEMNKLWVRMQHLGHSKDREKREAERKELRLLVGTNLVRMSQLEHVGINEYRKIILPGILEQIVSCRDVIAQEYIMECIIQVFPDEFHLATLNNFLKACSQLNGDVKVKNIMIALINRLSVYALKEGPSALVIDHDIKLFDVFSEQISQIIQSRANVVSPEDIVCLQSALINLALTCYPDNMEYVDRVLDATGQIFHKLNIQKIHHVSPLCKELTRMIRSIVDKYNDVLRVIKLHHLAALMDTLDKTAARDTGSYILTNAIENDTRISDVQNVDAIMLLMKPLLASPAGPQKSDNSVPGLVGKDDLVDDEEVDAQIELAKLINLMTSPDPDMHFMLLKTAYNHFNGLPAIKLKYTFPTLIYGCIEIAKAIKNAATDDDTIKNEIWSEKCRAIFRLIHEMVTTLTDSELFELALRLYLQAGLASGALKFAEYEAMAYEFFSQAFSIYEDDIGDSRSQFISLNLIISSFHSTDCFTNENHEPLRNQCASAASKLLKKPDQARALCLTAHLFWSAKILTDNSVKELHDGKKTLDYINKALKIANQCINFDVKMQLYVEILNNALLLNQNGCTETLPKEFLVNLINKVDKDLMPEMNSRISVENSSNGVGAVEALQIKNHYERTKAIILSSDGQQIIPERLAITPSLTTKPPTPDASSTNRTLAVIVEYSEMLASHVTAATVVLPLLPDSPAPLSRPRTPEPATQYGETPKRSDMMLVRPNSPSIPSTPTTDSYFVTDENEQQAGEPPRRTLTLETVDPSYNSADPFVLHAFASLRGAGVTIRVKTSSPQQDCPSVIKGIFSTVCPDLLSVVVFEGREKSILKISDIESLSAHNVDVKTSLLNNSKFLPTRRGDKIKVTNAHAIGNRDKYSSTMAGSKFMTDLEISSRNKIGDSLVASNQTSQTSLTKGVTGNSRKRSQDLSSPLNNGGMKELSPWQDEDDDMDDSIGSSLSLKSPSGGVVNSSNTPKNSDFKTFGKAFSSDFYTLEPNDDDGKGGGGWEVSEMFAVNELRFGLKSNYHEDPIGYTTALEHQDTPEFKEAQAKAARMAAEIESSATYQKHIALEDEDFEKELAGGVLKKKYNNLYNSSNQKSSKNGSFSHAHTYSNKRHIGKQEEARHSSGHANLFKNNVTSRVNASHGHRKSSLDANKHYVGNPPNHTSAKVSSFESGGPDRNYGRGYDRGVNKPPGYNSSSPSPTMTGYQNKFYNSKLNKGIPNGKTPTPKHSVVVTIGLSTSTTPMYDPKLTTNTSSSPIPNVEPVVSSHNNLSNFATSPLVSNHQQIGMAMDQSYPLSPTNLPSPNAENYDSLIEKASGNKLSPNKVKEETVEATLTPDTSSPIALEAKKILKSSKLNPNALSFIPNFQPNASQIQSPIVSSYSDPSKFNGVTRDMHITTEHSQALKQFHPSNVNQIIDYTGVCYYQNTPSGPMPLVSGGVSVDNNDYVQMSGDQVVSSHYHPSSMQLYNATPRSLSPTALPLSFGQQNQYEPHNLPNHPSSSAIPFPTTTLNYPGIQPGFNIRQGPTFTTANMVNNPNLDNSLPKASPHQPQVYILVHHPNMGSGPFIAHQGNGANQIFNLQQTSNVIPRLMLDGQNMVHNNGVGSHQLIGNPPHQYVAVGQPLQQAILVQTPTGAPANMNKPVGNGGFDGMMQMPTQNNQIQHNQYPYLSPASNPHQGSGYSSLNNQQNKLWVVPTLNGPSGYVLPYQQSQPQFLNPAAPLTSPIYRPQNVSNSSPFPLMNLPSQYHQSAHTSSNLNSSYAQYVSAVPMALPNFASSSMSNVSLSSPNNNPNMLNNIGNFNLGGIGNDINHSDLSGTYINAQNQVPPYPLNNKSQNHGENVRHQTTHYHISSNVPARNYYQSSNGNLDRRGFAIDNDMNQASTSSITISSAHKNSSYTSTYNPQNPFANTGRYNYNHNKGNFSHNNNYRSLDEKKSGYNTKFYNKQSANSNFIKFSNSTPSVDKTLPTDVTFTSVFPLKNTTDNVDYHGTVSFASTLPTIPTTATSRNNSMAPLRGCSSDLAIDFGKQDFGLGPPLHKSLSLNASPFNGVNTVTTGSSSIPFVPSSTKPFINYNQRRFNSIGNYRFRHSLATTNNGGRNNGSSPGFKKVTTSQSRPKHMGGKDHFAADMVTASPLTVPQSFGYLTMPPSAP